MKLDIKKKLLNRSDRVKSVDLHPTLPWVLTALYGGTVMIYDYNSQTQVRSIEITNAPVRSAKFIARKQMIVVGSDDNLLRVFNYNTAEKIKTIEEHTDYIRNIAVHPTQPYFISCSDDDTIRMFDWDKNWSKVNTFMDHDHYIMQVKINPKDPTMFASASLDKTIKIWTVGTTKSTANYTLMGHEAGVNCVDFSYDLERPHLVSGSDDGLVKIWDYQTRQCLYTFDQGGHQESVSSVQFHPDIPIIVSGGEDDVIHMWNSQTYKHVNQLNFGLKRIWAMSAVPENNAVAFGFDEGTVVIKIGKENPLATFSNGKVVWVKQNEVSTFNLKLLSGADDASKDGETVKPQNVKELGVSETFVQNIRFAPTGRYFAAIGDSDFVIYAYPKF